MDKVNYFQVVYCGKHSNIPDCCIRFYVEVWSPQLIKESGLIWDSCNYFIQTYLKIRRMNFEYRVQNGLYYCNYVQCPSCFFNDTYNSIWNCGCWYKRLDYNIETKEYKCMICNCPLVVITTPCDCPVLS